MFIGINEYETSRLLMDIEGLIRELGPVDSSALSAAILAQDEAAWHENSVRQETYKEHRETETILLLFTDVEGWPDIEITKEAGWEPLAKFALPLMRDIIDKHYVKGGTIIRAIAAKLLVGGRIKPHVDTHPSFHRGHRIHIPITTNPRVRFMIDGRPHQLQVGQAYEINNQKTHSVMNKGKEDRITFIFDYIPPQELGR